MTELMMKKKLETCQVRSGTARPCTRRAVVELQGVPFCDSCAREQEAYFAIGELTEVEKDAGGEGLYVVMNLMKKLSSRDRKVRVHELDVV